MSMEQSFNDLQEAVIKKLLATYQANLYFLHEFYPAVFERVMEETRGMPFSVAEDGDVFWLSNPEQKLSLVTLAERQHYFEQLKLDVIRLRIEEDYWSDHTQMTGHRDNDDFFRYTDAACRQELLTYFAQAEKSESTGGLSSKEAPICVLLGAGVGWSLRRIVEDWQIRHLIVAEYDLVRWVELLALVDLRSVHTAFSRKGGSLSLVVRDSSAALAEGIRGHVLMLSPPFMLQRTPLLLGRQPDAAMAEVFAQLRDTLWLAYQGWGFWDDEVLGLRQGLVNSAAGIPMLRRKLELPVEAVAIVVGSGPSLDDLAGELARVGDRAVVVSCGSALTALARLGIKPDIHLETERTDLTVRVLENAGLEAWLRDMVVVAPSNLSPRLFAQAGYPLMIAKSEDLAGAVLLPGVDALHVDTSPTCTNGGVDFVLRCGFRQVVLVGIDLGYRSAEAHHSHHSIYFQQADSGSEMAKVLEQTHAAHGEGWCVPGNFGGEVFSTPVFIHARYAMERTLAQFPDATVWNVNAGARIKGAQPANWESVSAHFVGGGKILALQKLLEAGEVVRPELEWEAQIQQEWQEIRQVMDLVFLSQESRNAYEVSWRLADMFETLNAQSAQWPTLYPALRGSLLHLGRIFYDGLWHLHETASDGWQAAFYDVLTTFMQRVQADLHIVATTNDET